MKNLLTLAALIAAIIICGSCSLNRHLKMQQTSGDLHQEITISGDGTITIKP